MADFSGLNQQQAIAAQIPYKNIALGNPAETFLNAWQMATNVRLKKSELEGKMAALAVKNRSLELDSQLDRAKFGLAVQRAESDAAHKGNMYELAAHRQATKDEMNQLSITKYNDLLDGQSSLLNLKSQADAQGLKSGEPGYRSFMLNGAASLIGKMPPSVLNKFISDVDKDETASIGLKQKALNAKKQDFMHTMSDTLYGTRANTDLYPILNYQQESPTLQTEYEPRGFHIPGFGTQEPPKPTGYKKVFQRDAAGKILPNPRRVPVTTLTDLNKQYQELQQQEAGIAPIPPTTGAMVKVRTSDGKEGTLPALRIDEAKQRDPGLVIIP